MGRVLLVAAALAALAVYLWAALGQSRVSELSTRLPALAYPARANGLTAETPAELRFLAQRFDPSTALDIEDRGRHFPAHVLPAFSPLHQAITLFTGLVFWAVCFFVFAPLGNRGGAAVFFWGLLVYGLAVMSGGIYCPPEPLWPNAARPLLRIASLGVIGVLFIHITLVFPKPRPRVAFLIAAYVVAAALVVWRGAALLAYLRAPSGAAWQARALPDRLSELFLVGTVATGCVILARASRTVELERERLQTQWVWWGVALGASPFVFLYTLPRVLGLPELVPLPVARLFACVVPLAFAFAVARHRMFDIDVIIRRSLIYGSLAALLALAYGVLALIVSRPLQRTYPGLAPGLPLAAAVLAVALFAPTRAAIGRWVDRTFFKLRYGYDHALAGYQNACGGARDDRDLGEITRACLETALKPKRCAVVLVDAGETTACGWEDEREVASAWASAHAEEPTRGGWLAARNATSLPESESSELAVWEALGWRLAFPLAGDHGPRGLILLGEKESERRYVESELAFVSGVAAEARATAERLRLVREVAVATLRRNRLADLDRLKTDFLSRIAHDLRTPLTSIRWSADNLLDGLAGDLNQRQSAYLDSIRSSSGQLERLVANLLEVSRLEEGRVRVIAQPVSLAPLISEAVVALLPQREAAGVEVCVSAGPDLGPVRGERDRLADVLFNLLENAIRYSPRGARVEVSVRKDGEGWQSIAVCDRGPGVPEDLRQSVFERFFQGPASPYAMPQGFGIGLYVVRSTVDLLGGQVHVEAAEGGGARFVCRLREWASEEVV